MSNAIILNGKRHVPTHAEGLYEHRCDLCSLKDEHLCDDNLEREYHMLDCCPLCQCLGGTHFKVDETETWQGTVRKTQGMAMYVNGVGFGEVWGACARVTPPMKIYIYTHDTHDKSEHEFTYEEIKTLLNGTTVRRGEAEYELRNENKEEQQ